MDHGGLAHALTACERDGFTGELRVPGSPGGAFHLRDGLVVAAESPGAPGAEALLLRSERVDGEQWAELVRESGARWPATGLIAHGYAGAAQLRVVCLLALRDAAFAVVAGRVDACERVTGTEPHALVAVGERPARLLEDAVRKVAAVDALPYPVRPDRERPLPVASPEQACTPLRREVLASADGRRTARDLAFRTGRGVYTVTVEVARMLSDGLLECADPPARVPLLVAPEAPVVRHREQSPAEPEATDPAELPRRAPGASGITEVLVPPTSGAGWKGFFRLRHETAG